jgi:hypothetical protein
VHDGVRLMLAEHAVEVFAVADIDVLERITIVMVNGLQRFEVTGVGLSTLTTESVVLAMMCRTTAEPIKPAPPVTKIFTRISYPDCWQLTRCRIHGEQG